MNSFLSAFHHFNNSFELNETLQANAITGIVYRLINGTVFLLLGSNHHGRNLLVGGFAIRFGLLLCTRLGLVVGSALLHHFIHQFQFLVFDGHFVPHAI
jgi:hypothetical protein